MSEFSTEILLDTIPAFQNNRYFDFKGPKISPGFCLRPNYELKMHLAQKGYDFKTMDMSKDPKSARAIICSEVPREFSRPFFRINPNEMKGRLYCILAEPPSVRPDNYQKSNHKIFRSIFTWDDDLVDNEKYFKFFYYLPFFEKEKIEPLNEPFAERKLLNLISSNKYSYHPDQLYGERIKAIRFMEKKHPADFDLYGVDWDLPFFHSSFAEKYWFNNVFKAASKMKKKLGVCSLGVWQFPSWKGQTTQKIVVSSKYKFSICYENMCNVRGYVSEKIMDCFRAGTVPIYFGASNICDYVPADCFIDFREFKGYSQLYDYISCISEGDHKKYLQNARTYLNSKKCAQFKIDEMIRTFDKVLVL